MQFVNQADLALLYTTAYKLSDRYNVKAWLCMQNNYHAKTTLILR